MSRAATLPKSTAPYAKQPDASVGAFPKSAFPSQVAPFIPLSDDDWVATLVNPDPKKTPYSVGMFWMHILLWVAALGLGATVNFGVTVFQKATPNATNAQYCASAPAHHYNLSGVFCEDPATASSTIAYVGGSCTIVGVVILLVATAFHTAEQIAEKTYISVLIQIFTLVGSFATLYNFTNIATKTTTVAFYLNAVAVGLLSFAQVMLYSTSAAIGVKQLPRAFLPSAAFAVQLISAIAINGEVWSPHSSSSGGWNEFTGLQKWAVWLLPIFNLVAVVIMTYLRMDNDGKGLKMDPFPRTLVLWPFLVSGILAVHKVAFLKDAWGPAGMFFAFIGAFLQFCIVAVVFMPSSESSQ